MTDVMTSPRAKVFGAMTASVLWCGVLLYTRNRVAHDRTYHFLVWNLFLAAIPFVVSNAMVWLSARRASGWVFWPLFTVWLLFLPNAPYILTDLYHLRWEDPTAPLWYDLALILSFAWNGLMLGYLSLMDVQALVALRRGARWGRGAALAALALSGFGIYIGRFLRWNSWDVVSHPRALALDLVDPLLAPRLHPRACGVTLVFSVFLILGYLLQRQIIALHAPKPAGR